MADIDTAEITLRTTEIDGEVYFLASDIANSLGYGRARNLTSWIEDDKVHKFKVNALPHNQHVNCLTIKGARNALARTRKPVPDNLARKLSVELSNIGVEYQEATVAKRLEKIFGRHEMSLEHKCGPYRIDVAFPAFGLAVEIDEEGHRWYDEQKETERAEFLADAGYVVIRYNPDEEPIETLYQQVHESIIANSGI